MFYVTDYRPEAQIFTDCINKLQNLVIKRVI